MYPHLIAASFLQAQDEVIHRDQAFEAGLTADALRYKVRANHWQLVLPAVYLTRPGDPTRRQVLVAALLYAGPGSQVDDADACRFHGIRAVPRDEQLGYVAVPQASRARSTSFVVVRRSNDQGAGEATDLLRYVDPATAVVAATRPHDVRRATAGSFGRTATQFIARTPRCADHQWLHRAAQPSAPRPSFRP
jgi:hypothetical protein